MSCFCLFDEQLYYVMCCCHYCVCVYIMWGFTRVNTSLFFYLRENLLHHCIEINHCSMMISGSKWASMLSSNRLVYVLIYPKRNADKQCYCKVLLLLCRLKLVLSEAVDTVRPVLWTSSFLELRLRLHITNLGHLHVEAFWEKTMQPVVCKHDLVFQF